MTRNVYHAVSCPSSLSRLAHHVLDCKAHAGYYASLAQEPRNFKYSNSELVDALKDITLPQLIDYVKTIWLSGKGEALIQGNYVKEEALDIVDTLDRTLSFKTISPDQYPARLKALPLPLTTAGEKPTRLSISEPNPQNNNAATQIALQSLGTSERVSVGLSSFSNIESALTSLDLLR